MNTITPLGGLVLETLSPLQFLVLHYDFFVDHPFINFPSELLFGLNQLYSSRLIIGTGTIFQKFIEVAQSSHKSLKLMVNSPLPNIANVVYDEGCLIVPASASSPALNPGQLSKEIKKYEVRNLPEINYSLSILDEKAGFLYKGIGKG